MNDQLIFNEKEITNAEKTQYYQFVIFASGFLYPIWGIVFSMHQRQDPMWVRLVLIVPPIILGLASYKFESIKRNLKKIIYTFASLIIAYQHILLYNNNLDQDYIFGGLILLFVLVNVILEAKARMIFAIVFCSLSYAVCAALLAMGNILFTNEVILHLFGVTTVGIFTVLNYVNYNKIHTAFIQELRDNTSLKRWSSVGQMAGGIAHEVNTPLTTMLLMLDSLKDKIENNKIDSAKKTVNDLIHTGETIGNIVQSLRLLTITGGQQYERDKVSLFDIMISVKNDYAPILKEKNIKFAYTYTVNGTGMVWGSAASLKHVITNLVKNAVDAIGEKEERWIKILLFENVSHYKLVVQNSGPLIPKEIAEKIFEPFFTTKDVGSGMGIGLSISKTLVLAHGGTITLDQKHNSVVFEIAIPKIKEELKSQRNKKAA